MVIEKFQEGAWATIVVTGCFVLSFILIRRHYDYVSAKVLESDKLLMDSIHIHETPSVIHPDPDGRVAVILVGSHLGAGIHELLTVIRLYPGVFKSFFFVSIGEIDTQSFHAEESLHKLKEKVKKNLSILVDYCRSRKLGADYMDDYGVDVVEKLTLTCENIRKKYPHSVFFATQLVFENDNMILRMLHNQTSTTLQRQLHFRGMPIMVLPMRV